MVTYLQGIYQRLHVIYLTFSLFGWLVADGWCWFVVREEYCWLILAGCWWLVCSERKLLLLQRCTFESLNYSNFGYTQILPFDKLKISRISAKPTALLVPSMLF
jgi:hypothetical protein